MTHAINKVVAPLCLLRGSLFSFAFIKALRALGRKTNKKETV